VAASQYPWPSAAGDAETMGLLRSRLPVEPSNGASPKEKIPPSEATRLYPPPSGMALMPTTGLFRGSPPVEP
jgi:hypothetical protein